MDFCELLADVNFISTSIRLLLSLLCGGILGMERGIKNRPAGFRTYMLVCMGATLVMITNQYMAERYAIVDPARMGAQVISGIGFLGAGTIIVTGRKKVHGLTTAAGLWAAACVGLAIGIGFYSGAIIGCVLTFVIMALLHNLDDKVTASARVLYLYVELASVDKLSAFLDYIKQNEFKLSDFEITRSKGIKESSIGVLLTLRSLTRMTHVEIVERLSKADGIVYLEEI